MARKSRKKNANLTFYTLQTEEHLLTALYVRLSHEEGMTDSTQKIRNQKELLVDFIRNKAEHELVDIYCDNGCTGTNFDRPEWNRLMEDVRRGKVNCIVVKDLSRLGRNYIEAGNYLEKVFPFLGVRFIAVSDSYDSAKSGQDMEPLLLPLKNIINASYAKDLSGKIRSARHVQRSRGEFTGNRVPFGYQRDPNRKGRFIIEESAAKIVKEIFGYLLQGCNFSETARKLNEQGILSPQGKLWSYNVISMISSNPVYIGNLIQGKNCVYGSDVVVMEQTHEAIIEPELFYAVQKNREKLTFHRNKIGIPEAGNYLFEGFLYASNSGRPLCRTYYWKQNGTVLVKAYRSPKVLDESGKAYPLYMIREETLLSCVREVIFQYIEVLNVMEEYLKQEKVSLFYQGKLQRMAEKVEQHKRKLGRIHEILADMYADTVAGMIKPADYKVYSDKYAKDSKAAEQELAQVLKEQELLKKSLSLENPFLKILRDFGKNDAITRELLENLVDRIIVSGSKEIEIHFTFEDEFKTLYELKTEYEAGRSIYGC